MVTIILIGTVHETKREENIFVELNRQVKLKKYKNAYWLCEGEAHDRKCFSLKDNDLHLLTDALFVNMMLLDVDNVKDNEKGEFMQSLYERIMELFITINNSKFKDKIVNDNGYINCLNLLDKYNIIKYRDNYEECIKQNYGSLKSKLRVFIKYLLDVLLENNIINESNKKCVYDFYNTGYKCENEIMTIMREKSFIKIILLFIMDLLKQSKNKVRIIITVGLDHVEPLKRILGSITNNIKIIF